MMKKLTVLLISLLMICSFAAAQTMDYIGTWYLVLIETEGVEFNPADLGMEMVITLHEDGTGLLSMTNEEDGAATWTADGKTITVTANGDPLTFVLTDEGTLTAETDGNILTMGREAPGPGFVPASEITVMDIEEFDGTWNATTVNAYGMVVPFSTMSEMGMTDGIVLIQNGNITFLGGEEVEVGTLIDGKLVVPSLVEDATFGKSISLLEDGSLSVEFMGMIFYCEKAETTE